MRPEYIANSAGSPSEAEALFKHLWNELPWEDRGAPRREVFFNDNGQPYTYGSGRGERTYAPHPEWNHVVREIQRKAEALFGCKFEGCFINGYADQRQHLGWHADDSPSIDPHRPILVYSFGAAREIWVKPRADVAVTNDRTPVVEKYLLEPGSLFVMPAGMQQTHLHRIPKHHAACGPRISITLRGLA